MHAKVSAMLSTAFSLLYSAIYLTLINVSSKQVAAAQMHVMRCACCRARLRVCFTVKHARPCIDFPLC